MSFSFKITQGKNAVFLTGVISKLNDIGKSISLFCNHPYIFSSI